MVFVIDKLNNINLSAKYKYGYFKICVYIYVAYAGLRMSADRDSPDDIHSAVENENTVSAYFISKQILPFGFAVAAVPVIEHRLYRCHGAI